MKTGKDVLHDLRVMHGLIPDELIIQPSLDEAYQAGYEAGRADATQEFEGSQ